jgi:hypothetical protein
MMQSRLMFHSLRAFVPNATKAKKQKQPNYSNVLDANWPGTVRASVSASTLLYTNIAAKPFPY